MNIDLSIFIKSDNQKICIHLLCECDKLLEMFTEFLGILISEYLTIRTIICLLLLSKGIKSIFSFQVDLVTIMLIVMKINQ